MSAKQAAAWILASILAIIAWLALGGCASVSKNAPVPGTVSVVPVRRAVAVTRERNESARVRVENVVREIETIKEVVPTEVVERLTALQQQLFKVTAELREAHESIVIAETQIAMLEKEAEAVRQWGITQQKGWHKEEAAHENTREQARETLKKEQDRRQEAEDKKQEAEIDRDKARAIANKRGNTLGLLGAGAMALCGLTGWGIKLAFAFPPWSLSLFAILPAIGYFGARIFL